MNIRTTLSIALAVLTLSFFTANLNAQTFSATLNASPVTTNKVSNGLFNINGSTNLSINLRLYNDSKFAYRLGAGIENLEYSLANGIQTDLRNRRQDLKFMAGFEWHPTIGSFIDIYPGVYVPLTFIGNEDGVSTEIASPFSAGVGGVIGANIRFLGFLRAGVEFDAKYESFKTAIGDAVGQGSTKPFGRMNKNLNFTLGVVI